MPCLSLALDSWLVVNGAGLPVSILGCYLAAALLVRAQLLVMKLRKPEVRSPCAGPPIPTTYWLQPDSIPW